MYIMVIKLSMSYKHYQWQSVTCTLHCSPDYLLFYLICITDKTKHFTLHCAHILWIVKLTKQNWLTLLHAEIISAYTVLISTAHVQVLQSCPGAHTSLLQKICKKACNLLTRTPALHECIILARTC